MTSSGLPAPLRSLLSWVFPVIVVAAAGVLTALDLNGTSIALNGPDWKSDPALVAGSPRSIRSDEFGISTPLLVGNDRRGLPTQPWIGLNDVDLPATSISVPSAHWTALFKPYEWGFFTLDTSHALALRWWSLLAIGVLGSYALVLALTRHALLAVGTALLVACTPYSGWWSLTPALALGLTAAGTACVVQALSGRGRDARGLIASAGWGLVAGYFGVALFLMLYPPWLISTAWIGLAVVAGVVLDRRPPGRRILVTLAAALAVLLPAGGAWYAGARDAVAATTGTYYPGNRLSSAGGASLSWLLDTPSSIWFSLRTMQVEPADVTATGQPLAFANTSELASTWVPLPLVLVALALTGRLAFARRRARLDPAGVGSLVPQEVPNPPHALLWTASLVAAATALLLAWALLPLPDVVGRFTLLDRVPGRRAPQAIGFGCALVLALGATAVRRARPSWWVAVPAVAAGVATLAAHVWAVGALRWTGPQPPVLHVVIVALGVTAGLTLMLTGRLVGVAALSAGLASLAVFAVINPLYRGLGPFADDPVVRALQPYGGPRDPARVAVFANSPGALVALVSASGVENLSGLTVYPDAALWQQLAPGQERQWNNWSKYAWIADPAAAPARIEPWRGTYQRLRLNLCAPQVRALELDLALSTGMIASPCLTLARTFERAGTTLYLYRTTAPPAP